MFVKDFEQEFIQLLTGKKIFILLNYDIDSICTCKILQKLLQYNHTIYAIDVVTGLDDVRELYLKNSPSYKFYLFINCCGTVDIIEFLEPEDEKIFFVLDAHRPTDLSNIYSNGQVRLLSSPDEEGVIPDFYDVFREEENDSEDEGGSNDEDDQEAKRRRSEEGKVLPEERILRRRERRRWEENRNKILFEYSQFSFYHRASAIFMFNMAWQLNQDDIDLLWLAIVALTEQITFHKIETTQYILQATELQEHSGRLQNSTKKTDLKSSVKISIERDLRLILHRHWTCYDSLKYSMHTACRMRLWDPYGDINLQKLLLDMSLPLSQSKGTFKTMDVDLRNEFHLKLQEFSEKYGLGDLMLTTFSMKYGYAHQFSAIDVVYAMNAILECNSNENHKECFSIAMDSVSRKRNELIYNGIERAKLMTKVIFGRVKNALETRRIMRAGPFFYFIIPDGCEYWRIYNSHHVLIRFAHFLQRAYVTGSKNKKAHTMPFIVSAPCSQYASKECIITGIPPLCEDSPKNFFGKAFEQAAERIKLETYCDYFDTSFFHLPTSRRSFFIDALTVLLS